MEEVGVSGSLIITECVKHVDDRRRKEHQTPKRGRESITASPKLL